MEYFVPLPLNKSILVKITATNGEEAISLIKERHDNFIVNIIKKICRNINIDNLSLDQIFGIYSLLYPKKNIAEQYILWMQ